MLTTGTGACTGALGSEVVRRYFPNAKVSETTVVSGGKRNGIRQLNEAADAAAGG